MNAIENDSRVTMHSRPRIQTRMLSWLSCSLAIRMVVTGTITDISGGTVRNIRCRNLALFGRWPFINEEGLVVMDLVQQIQDIVGSKPSTAIVFPLPPIGRLTPR